MTAFQIKVLEAMSPLKNPVTAGWLAGTVWQAKGKCLAPHTGRWQKMGAVLEGLRQGGLVHRRIDEHNQKLWTISTFGRDAILASGQSKEGKK